MKYIVRVPEIHILSVEVDSDVPLKVGEIKEKVSALMAEGKTDGMETQYDCSLGVNTWSVEAKS
jgi:hypothetical protein